MRKARQVLLLVVASATIGTVASAQDTRPDSEACRDSAATGLYRRCALWMEGNKVRRGEDGVVVARQAFIIPPRLSRVVVGDSALAYANLFERRSKQATAMAVLGGVLMAISVANAECGGDYNGCAYDWGFNSPGFPLLLAGVASIGIGAHLQARGLRAGAQAVWWNNARYAR
jgi:hypothetical protein